MEGAISKGAPLKSKRLRPSKSSWITTGLKKRMNYRDHLKKKAVKKNSLIDWNHYRTLKNQINNEIKIAKQNYYYVSMLLISSLVTLGERGKLLMN